MPFSSVIGASSVIRPGVCTSTTRPSVPYEGQLIYETDTDRVAAYNGSAWVYTHSSGLVLVKTQTIGTAVSSVTVSDVFSSSYDNYKITINGGVASTAVNLRLQLGAVTSGYRVQLLYGSYANSALAVGSTGNASYLYGGAGNTARLYMNAELNSPNLAKPTMITASGLGVGDAGVSVGYVDGTDQFTAFTVFPESGTITGGTIRVYGYANS